MLGIKIEIEEIDNGFIVDLFSKHGNTEYDKTIFVESKDKLIPEIETWLKKVK